MCSCVMLTSQSPWLLMWRARCILGLTDPCSGKGLWIIALNSAGLCHGYSLYRAPQHVITPINPYLWQNLVPFQYMNWCKFLYNCWLECIKIFILILLAIVDWLFDLSRSPVFSSQFRYSTRCDFKTCMWLEFAL